VGPFDTPSLRGDKYFLTFIDKMTTRIWLYLLKEKEEVFFKIVKFFTLVEKELSGISMMVVLQKE